MNISKRLVDLDLNQPFPMTSHISINTYPMVTSLIHGTCNSPHFIGQVHVPCINVIYLGQDIGTYISYASWKSSGS